VQQVEIVPFEKEDFGFGQAAARSFAIDVAAHGMDGCDLLEFFEDRRFAHVPEVKDLFYPVKRGQDFRAQ
jgi:hypothetical protein